VIKNVINLVKTKTIRIEGGFFLKNRNFKKVKKRFFYKKLLKKGFFKKIKNRDLKILEN
jgi:hypothetical protein